MSNFRSENYRRFVASLPCIKCGKEGVSQAAHSNSAAFGKGKSLKAHDWAIFPLCSTSFEITGCHADHDSNKKSRTKIERIDQEAFWIAKTIGQAFVSGQLQVVKVKQCS
jgi:hypothetical protein